MAEVRWTPQAVDDLESIADFIARDSPDYAQLFVMDALAVTVRLDTFPNSGRVVPPPEAPLPTENPDTVELE